MKKILIIDDDIAICKQIKYNLQNETTEVYYAKSVSDALLFMLKNECCLIILEITLSETGGTELLHAIRRCLELNPNYTRNYTIVEVDLTGKEYSILTLLVSNPDRYTPMSRFLNKSGMIIILVTSVG